MSEAIKTGLLIIATNKYIDFLPNLIESADKFFLPNNDVEYFVFTDQEDLNLKSDRKITVLKTEHKQWPWMTLGRYKIFNDNKSTLKNKDYLFYCDVDMLFCDTVGDEILSERVATLHPGFNGGRGTPETNPNSLACVYPFEKMQYFAGGFNGGSSDTYLKMCEKLSKNIKTDHDNGVIAIWHDESHMNRYFIDNPPTKILGVEYCTPSNSINKNTKLSALVKNHGHYRQ